jgi:hypothetical protein
MTFRGLLSLRILEEGAIAEAADPAQLVGVPRALATYDHLEMEISEHQGAPRANVNSIPIVQRLSPRLVTGLRAIAI